MLRGVMNVKPFEDSSRLRRRKSLVEGRRLMGVEIVHHKCDPLGIGIPHINHRLDFFRPVSGGPVLPDANVTDSLQRRRVKAKMLHVPFLTYSESTFLLLPGRIGSGPLASPGN